MQGCMYVRKEERAGERFKQKRSYRRKWGRVMIGVGSSEGLPYGCMACRSSR